MSKASTSNQKKYSIKKFSCMLVKENLSSEYCLGDREINNPEAAAKAIIAFTHFNQRPQEELWVMMLNGRSKLIGVSQVSIGTINSSPAEVSSLFRSVILSGASGIIIFHAHPSGDVTPSSSDIITTKKMIDAGKILDIAVLDHIIVNYDGAFHSMRESDTCKF